jgi:hypothetical protein
MLYGQGLASISLGLQGTLYPVQLKLERRNGDLPVQIELGQDGETGSELQAKEGDGL